MNKRKIESDWKIKDGRIIECIVTECSKKPWAEGLCIEHYDEENKNE